MINYKPLCRALYRGMVYMDKIYIKVFQSKRAKIKTMTLKWACPQRDRSWLDDASANLTHALFQLGPHLIHQQLSNLPSLSKQSNMYMFPFRSTSKCFAFSFLYSLSFPCLKNKNSKQFVYKSVETKHQIGCKNLNRKDSFFHIHYKALLIPFLFQMWKILYR